MNKSSWGRGPYRHMSQNNFSIPADMNKVAVFRFILQNRQMFRVITKQDNSNAVGDGRMPVPEVELRGKVTLRDRMAASTPQRLRSHETVVKQAIVGLRRTAKSFRRVPEVATFDGLLPNNLTRQSRREDGKFV